MEFQAYPSMSQPSKLSTLWRMQGRIHGGENLVLPGALLLAAGSLILYEHFTGDAHGWDLTSTRSFLALILVTMLPLAFLEKKIFSCADPVTKIAQISGKVLLSHASFLALRVAQHYLSEGVLNMNFVFCLTALASACVLLPTCFGCCSVQRIFYQNRDVWGMILSGVVAAILTEVLNYCFGNGPQYHDGRGYFWTFFAGAVETAALYTELLAFVPAVWTVCWSEKSTPIHAQQDIDVVNTRTRALAFFAFVLGFYFTEDLVGAYMIARDGPIAALGHVAHFLLLLDFAGFVLAHLYDPAKLEKLMGSIMNMFTDVCAV